MFSSFSAENSARPRIQPRTNLFRLHLREIYPIFPPKKSNQWLWHPVRFHPVFTIILPGKRNSKPPLVPTRKNLVSQKFPVRLKGGASARNCQTRRVLYSPFPPPDEADERIAWTQNQIAFYVIALLSFPKFVSYAGTKAQCSSLTNIMSRTKNACLRSKHLCRTIFLASPT
jgi:hypothetical protein